MKKLVISIFAGLLLLLGGLVHPMQVKAEVYTYNNGGLYLDQTTVPTGLITTGSSGQIIPRSDSILSGFQYAFYYNVSDPTVVSIDARGQWTALQSGKATITISVPSQQGESPLFEQELDQRGIIRASVEPTIAYPDQMFQVEVVDNKPLPVYRLYHPGLKTHLYTLDSNEWQTLMTRGWILEGNAWTSRPVTGEPIYRLYHPGLRVHLYTRDKNEYTVLGQVGWRQEGISYRSNGTIPVYRLYHEGIQKHLYTTSKNEKNVLSTRGWRYEGVAWNVE